MSLTDRRQFLAALGAGLGSRLVAAAPSAKSIRGVFPIMATPFTESKEVDFDDLVKEVDFLDRCGVHGMVWPQLASEYWLLKKEERLRGMELLARAALEVLLRRASARQLPELREDEGEGRGEPGQGGEDAR